uniref:Protein quiver n=1 Tax=Heliothis virescens TaxID=7102 RepID=A0A2A4J6D6_HELVI
MSIGYLQETTNLDDHSLIQPDGKKADSEWPLQTVQTIQENFYDGAKRTIDQKPCSRRSNSGSDPIEQHLSPPVTSKQEKLPKIVASLKPQSLRHGENDLKINDKKPPPQSPQFPIIPENLHTTRKALPISNPVIDSSEKTHREILRDNYSEDEKATPMRLAPNSDHHPPSTSIVRSANSRRNQSPSPSVTHFISANEYSEPENSYISDPSNVIPTVLNDFRSTNLNKPQGDLKSDFFPEILSDDPTDKLTEKSKPQPNPERSDASSDKPNKCLHDNQNNIEGHSRRSMSNHNEDDRAYDIPRKDKVPNQNNKNPHIESNRKNVEAMASVLNAEKSTLKSGQDLKNANQTKLPVHEKSVSRVRPQFNEARREMAEPTRGSKMGESALMLMQSERVCYACSTANNPSCWAPDRRTTVKYCRKGNNACIIKTFGQGDTFTLIRDCGNSCDDSSMGGIMPKYKSCSMCHSELCNGAYSVSGHNIMLAIILTAIVKYYNKHFC